jgi:hypothetical protein
MSRKRTRDRDVVAELQEDARWSSYTNSTVRWHQLGGRGGLRSSPGRSLAAPMLIALVAIPLFVGAVWGIYWLVSLFM